MTHATETCKSQITQETCTSVWHAFLQTRFFLLQVFFAADGSAALVHQNLTQEYCGSFLSLFLVQVTSRDVKVSASRPENVALALELLASLILWPWPRSIWPRILVSYRSFCINVSSFIAKWYIIENETVRVVWTVWLGDEVTVAFTFPLVCGLGLDLALCGLRLGLTLCGLGLVSSWPR